MRTLLLKLLFSTLILFCSSLPAHALINIIAAENIYGEVAQELGGPYVQVTSILNNPDQDPHLFAATASTVKTISQADIIIYNGVGYDPWMNSLLPMDEQVNRKIINVGSLAKVKDGSNPHIWYDPQVMPLFAKFLVSIYIQQDPAHGAYFSGRLQKFNQDYQAIVESVSRVKMQFAKTPIIATEPVFNYMAQAMGLKVLGLAFQENMMNDVPPSVSEVEDFENSLNQHQVKLLIYNNQVVNPVTEHMKGLAQKNNIPVVGVSETIPPHLTFNAWMLLELRDIENALRTQK